MKLGSFLKKSSVVAALLAGTTVLGQTATTPTISAQAETMFSLANELYPTLFKNGSALQIYQDYTYKAFSGGIYVGIKNGKVFLMGGPFGTGITDKGYISEVVVALQDFKYKSNPANSAGLPAGFVARTPPAGIINAADAVVWTGSKFVALEQSTDYHNASAKFFAWTSTDGIAWSRATTNMISTYVDLSTANGKAFQISTSSVIGSTAITINSSDDGINWTPSTVTYTMGSYSASPLGVKYLNGRYFASMDVNTCNAISSTDATNWTSTNLATLALPTNYTKDTNQNFCSEPFYVGGKFLIYGGVIKDYKTSSTNPPAKGLVYSSTDGTTWVANAFALPTGANAIEQGGRVSNVISVGNKIVIPTVMTQTSRRIKPTDPYPTLVTDSAQTGTSTDGLVFTYASTSGISYAATTVGTPGLTQYFTGLEVEGSGLLGYNFSNATNYWTLDGVNYTATQDMGLRSATFAYTSRFAYSPSLKRLVVIQWVSAKPATPTIMTKDF